MTTFSTVLDMERRYTERQIRGATRALLHAAGRFFGARSGSAFLERQQVGDHGGGVISRQGFLPCGHAFIEEAVQCVLLNFGRAAAVVPLRVEEIADGIAG